MKSKKGLSAIVAIILIILLVIAGVVLVWASIKELSEPHFKITENGEEEEYMKFIVQSNNYDICKFLDLDSIAIPFGDGYGCVNLIYKQEIKTKWLNEKCECIEGWLDKDPDTQCEIYQCGNYKVDVWNQIK